MIQQRQMYDPTLSMFEAINSNEPEWAPVITGGWTCLPQAGVRWEIFRFETTVCSVCIWLEFFRQLAPVPHEAAGG